MNRHSGIYEESLGQSLTLDSGQSFHRMVSMAGGWHP